MPYWLADARHGQQTDHIQRFEPRFWTVDFPRPMMASLVTTAPDSLRVACEFHHAGELAGLIWDSEDGLDHPLLAYETDRDYRRTTLSFRWRSHGLVPLDAVHGPTLTIEGRDAGGEARSWYVRLWNYAEGSPEDARIVLPFSELESGFTLPGEPVFAGDIDRMFVSFVPPGYAPGSTDRLAARVDGWAELTDIACQGDRPMLEIGDVLVPPHGERIATAYDDAYNQAPARLLRQIRGLGYRGRIVHYVGMSHFFRLGPDLLARPDGALCGPAREWHEAYFAGCAALGHDPIVSLSYELFAAHCPQDWQQRAHDGQPARTGWKPPSALLSPATPDANAWLRGAAEGFVALQRDAGLPVLFQVGEPWWWVTPEKRRPCLYDDAAAAVLDPIAPRIASMAGPLNDAQEAQLDRAGELLAGSTLALAQAVREAAGDTPAEIMLLCFTPTVLDPEMPELYRANLPSGWAHPAFDRLQLEDYDWLTAGREGLSEAAYSFVDARLSYPAERQDYLAGFVLLAQDARTHWELIDRGLDRAARRGIAHRYVWALPQVARDGYVRLPASIKPTQEFAMQPFDDVAYPLPLGLDASASPEFSTSVAVTASGHERRNAHWSDARLRFDVGPGVRSEADLATLIAFFRARHGAARGFRLSDPFDHLSGEPGMPPGPIDQPLGTGDGARTRFALVKLYGEGADPQRRPITRPLAGTVRASVDGVETAGFALEPGGILRFDEAPPAGSMVAAGFAFDVPVRFAEDRLDVSGAAFAAGEAPSVPLIELREAA